MKRESNFFWVLGVFLFVAFLAMNFSISGSYQNDETLSQLTLIELAAKAQSEDENGWYGEGTPYWSVDFCVGHNACGSPAEKCAWDGYNVCDVSAQKPCSTVCCDGCPL